MTGSILNAAGILIGGALGLILRRQFATSTQLALRGLIGVLTVVIGLHLTWSALNGSFFQVFKQVVIMILALTAGRITGRLLRIQRTLKRVGKYANERIEKARQGDANRLNDGFAVCALLFCAGPWGPVGAVEDGLTGYWAPLAIKAAMDGLATMGFVSIFGWGAMLSALPVFVVQGTITQAAHRLEPFLRAHNLVDSVNAVSGILIFCVALIALELKKLELADYLPSLAMAPLITWLWH
jgi:uncharacterized membrane protein YqgA involved in biofilm formation